jgi:hypothetical protein
MQRAVSTKGFEAGSTWRGEALRQTGSHLSRLRMCSGLHDRDCMGRRLWEGSGATWRWPLVKVTVQASSLENSRGSSCGTWPGATGAPTSVIVCAASGLSARIEGVPKHKAKRRLVRLLPVPRRFDQPFAFRRFGSRARSDKHKRTAMFSHRTV